MPRGHRSSWLVVLFSMVLAACPAAAQEAPADVVARLHDGLLDAAANRDAPWETRYAELAPLIVATHDLEYIGRITIRRHWRDLDPSQRADFTTLFQRLAIANYVARFGALTDAEFATVGSEPLSESRYEVATTLTPGEGEAVTLVYVLQQRTDERWRIINVVANDVSDLALKRAEYQRVLRDSDFAGLLEHIQTQADNLQAGK